MNPTTLVPVVSVRYLPTAPLELASPCGNFDDFEFSRIRADSQRARREDDDARADVVVAIASSCRCRRRRREAVRVDGDLARHRVGDERQLARLQRRRDQHARATRSSSCVCAAAAALAAVVARRPAVERLA